MPKKPIPETDIDARTRLRALAVAKGYDLNSEGLPDAAEIMRLADEPTDRELDMTKANRHRRRAFLLGIDPGTPLEPDRR